ncbi:MAG: hypothetical protein HY046_05430 [Acidobacteria bacterium]|nr:hypothetical protein [Acidobacteriota bacterium]
MTRTNIFTGLRLAVLLAFATTFANAQVNTGKPVVLKPPKHKLAVFKGEVLSATNYSVTVRNPENNLQLRTFTYSPECREKMQKIIDAGGFQHGDKIQIQYEPGTDVIIKFKGKPSKPK